MLITQDTFARRYQAPETSVEDAGGGGGGAAAVAEPAESKSESESPEPSSDTGDSSEGSTDSWGEQLPDYDFEPAGPEELIGDVTGEVPSAADQTVQQPQADPPADNTPTSEREADAGNDPSSQGEDIDGFPTPLLDRAARLGMGYQDVRAYGNAATLEHAINREEMVRRSTAPAPAMAPQAEQPPLNQQLTGQQYQPQGDEATEPDFDQMIADGHDENMVSIIRNQHHQLKQSNAQLSQLSQASQVQSQQAAETQFRQTLNGLGSDYSKVIGADPSVVHPTSREAENQQAIRSLVGFIETGMQQSGLQPLPQAQLIRIALNGVAGDHLKQTARSEVTSRIRQNGSQATNPPNATSGRQLKGEARAVERLEKFFSENEVT